MPRRKTSLKRTRADKKRHLRNLRVKHSLKKALKKFQALLSVKNITEAKTYLAKVFSELDKAAKKNIIHSNKAARIKSIFAKKISQKKALKTLRKNLDRINALSNHIKEASSHKYFLIQAELAKIKNLSFSEVMEAYNVSIDSAKKNGYLLINLLNFKNRSMVHVNRIIVLLLFIWNLSILSLL